MHFTGFVCVQWASHFATHRRRIARPSGAPPAA